MASNNVTIKRTGELMLSGWKMLATTCPVCNTALMEKGADLRCPRCDLPVFKEEDHRVQGTAISSIDHKADSKSSIVSEPTSLEEIKKEYDAKNKRQDVVSGKLGEKMLSGWTLLATTCPSEECRGTPLMSLKDSPMHCVSCSQQFVISKFGELVDVSSNAAISATLNLNAVVVSERADDQSTSDSTKNNFDEFDMNDLPILSKFAFAEDQDSASYKISQKLMKGWALLDEVCLSVACGGSVPLMRDHNGEKHCVQCGYAAGKSGEVLLKGGVVPTAQVTHKQSAAVVDEESDEDSDADVEGFFSEWRAKLAKETAHKTQVEVTPAHTVKSKSTGAEALHGDPSSAILAVLLKKLTLAGVALEESTSLDKSLKLTQLISQLGDAIRSMRAISNQVSQQSDVDCFF